MEAGDSGPPGPTAPGPVELEYSQQSENVTTPSESLNLELCFVLYSLKALCSWFSQTGVWR